MRTVPAHFEGIEPLEPRQHLAAVFWDGGGGDGSWQNPLNWSADVLPGPGDDVTINVAGVQTVRFDQDVAVSVHSIVCAERLELSRGSISAYLFWRQTGVLELSGGSIAGPGVVTIGPAARLVIPAQPSALQGPSILGRLLNFGAIEWTGPGTLTLRDGLVNSGTMAISGQAYINAPGGLAPTGAPAWVYNFGTLTVAEGATVTFRGAGGGVRLMSYTGSALNVNGTANLFGGVAGRAQWSVSAGHEIAIGGWNSVLISATIHAPGRLRLGRALQVGALTMDGAGETVIGQAGTLKLAGSDNQIVRSSTVNHGWVMLLSGITSFGGTFDNRGSVMVSPGTLKFAAYISAVGSNLWIETAPGLPLPYIQFLGPAQLGGNLLVEAHWPVYPGYQAEFYTGSDVSGTFDGVLTTAAGRSVLYLPMSYRGMITGSYRFV